MKAYWNNQLLADSDKTIIVENNHYFPPESLNKKFFQPSETSSHCPWKGNASYYSVVVDGETNADSAWYYPDPMDAAMKIKDYVAFWRGVKIVE